RGCGAGGVYAGAWRGGRMERGCGDGGCGGQAAGVRLEPALERYVHVLGGGDWWSVSHYGEPRNGPVDCAAAAGGAQRAASKGRADCERCGGVRNVRAVSGDRDGAVGVLPQGGGGCGVCAGGCGVSDIYCDADAARIGGSDGGGDSGGGDVEPERVAEFAVVDERGGFLRAVVSEYERGAAAEAVARVDGDVGAGA